MDGSEEDESQVEEVQKEYDNFLDQLKTYTRSPASLLQQGWDDQAISLLITLWGERKMDFYTQSSKKKQLWGQVAEVLTEVGYEFNWSDCRAAWKVMVANYEVALENDDTMSCHFFEEMTYVHSAEAEDLQTDETMRTLVDGGLYKILLTDDGTTVLLQTGNKEQAEHRRMMNSTFPQNSGLSDAIEVLEMIKNMNEDLKQMKCERLALIKSNHQQNIQMLSRLIAMLDERKTREHYTALSSSNLESINLDVPQTSMDLLNIVNRSPVDAITVVPSNCDTDRIIANSCTEGVIQDSTWAK